MAVIFDDVSYRNKLLNLNFKIIDKTITGIIGQRESGKTAIVDLLNEDFTPTYGYIYTEDKIGVVYQNIKDQFFYDNIKEEFIFQLKINGTKNTIKKMNDAIKIVGFNNKIFNKNINDLSLSEQKRIALALVLATNPKIIVLDDIFFGLDEKTKNQIIKIIRLLKVKYDKSIVITSTDSDLIHSISDEVILINNGSIIKTGNKYEILTNDSLMKRCNLPMPKIIKFSKIVFERKFIDLGYRDDINDLMKDIYRFVR